MMTFEELGISKEIVLALVDLGFEVPMPVQEKVIPLLLGEKTDIVALAQTGTGKTAAYGLPLIQQIDTGNSLPQALILCPTRELCVQIAGDLNDYAKYIDNLHVLPVYGGSSYDVQIKALKRGVQIVVATPGRLIDLMHRKAIKLRDVQSVVLDEADEMLNMGFLDSINDILAEVPENRSTLLFSATMPKEVAVIAKKYMNKPVEITIGNRNSGAENIKHVYYTVHAKDKYTALKRIVDFYPSIYGIVFCRTRIDTQEIADKLIGDGYNAEALHGDLSQVQRDSVMQKFRIRHVQLLVATDVAARGLDVNDLTHIINYALPDDLSAYTHRSGRTGRAGKAGTSIAIINLKEKHLIRQIEKLINKSFIAAKVPGGREICEKQLFNLINKMENVEIENSDIDPFLPAIYKKLEWLEKEEVIKRFVALEFNRFLEYYRNAKDINVFEEKGRESFRDKPGKESFRDRGGKESFRDKGGRNDSRKEVTDFTRLVINAGKGDGLYPNNLIELINANSPGKRIRIGDITLGKNDGVFEVDSEYAKFLAQSLSEAEFKGATLSVGIAKGEAKVDAGERRSFKEKGKFKGTPDFKKGAGDFKKGAGDFKKSPADSKKKKESPEDKDEEIKSWIKSKGDNPFAGSEEWAGKKKKKKK
ncbi:MAG: DEAD/DEAH box helicase [Bacteroidetes bacterium]|nr:DEAD/DEAH box helicase [Bacteroidota bacterium]